MLNLNFREDTRENFHIFYCFQSFFVHLDPTASQSLRSVWCRAWGTRFCKFKLWLDCLICFSTFKLLILVIVFLGALKFLSLSCRFCLDSLGEEVMDAVDTCTRDCIRQAQHWTTCRCNSVVILHHTLISELFFWHVKWFTPSERSSGRSAATIPMAIFVILRPSNWLRT